MARRASHSQRRAAVERSQPGTPPDEVAAQLLEDWRQTRPDAVAGRPRTDVAPAAAEAEGVEYRVQRLEAAHGPALRAAARLQAELTARAAEGWRLRAIVPAPPHEQLAIFERAPEQTEASEPAPATARAARGHRTRRRNAGMREWESARERFAAERADALAGQIRRPSRRNRRPPGGADVVRRRRATALGLLVVASLVVGILATGAGSDEPPPPSVPAPEPGARDAAPAPRRAERPALPACRDVPAGSERDRAVTCTTRTRVLTIAGPGRSVEIAGVRNRIVSVRRDAGAVTVRVGLHNRSARALDLTGMPGRTSLVAGGMRLGPPAGTPPSVLRPGGAAEADLRFALTPAAEAAFARTGGRADLGVGSSVPGDSRRAGVLRLVVPQGA
jgi:hypothetical protein